jgi:hypothetical protein
VKPGERRSTYSLARGGLATTEPVGKKGGIVLGSAVEEGRYS